MKDKFGREINYLRISVTDLCNLRCRYCMPETGIAKNSHENILTVEEIIQAAQAASELGMHKIRITGGEPLVRKGIIGICEGISEAGGIRELCMTTNGVLLPQYANQLKQAGVDRLNISLDTLDPAKYRYITRAGELHEAIAGIDAAEKAGFAGTKINAVLIDGFNTDEIQAFADFSKERGVEVRFIELMPIGEAKEKNGFASAGNIISGLEGYSFAGMDGVAAMYENGSSIIGFITAVSCGFCSSCSKLRLMADGYIRTCLYGDDGICIKGYNKQEMKDALSRAVSQKPESKEAFGNKASDMRKMNRIGG